MCKRFVVAGYFLVVGSGPIARAGAQDLRMMERRLDREVVVMIERQKANAAFEALGRSMVATDTIPLAAGAVTILTHRAIAETVRDAVARAETDLRQIGGAASVIRGASISVQRDTSRRPYGEREGGVIIMRLTKPDGRGDVMAESKDDADAIARSLAEIVVNSTMDHVRNPFFHWRRSAVPLRKEDLDVSTDWSAVRYDVLSSPSLLGPRCFKGEIVACSMLLGLTTVDDPVMAWYDSAARYDEVKANRARAVRFNRTDTEQCLQGDDPACVRALHGIDVFEQPPAGGISRDALMREAIRIGGDRAAERMIVNKGTVAEALAAGARAPVDSVVRAWQHKLRGASLGTEDMSWRIALVAIGWIALLLGLSTRITRWR